eukprot:scaffold1405_cov225-Pinguiococcus_pyrenoidosus.AAC.3
MRLTFSRIPIAEMILGRVSQVTDPPALRASSSTRPVMCGSANAAAERRSPQHQDASKIRRQRLCLRTCCLSGLGPGSQGPWQPCRGLHAAAGAPAARHGRRGRRPAAPSQRPAAPPRRRRARLAGLPGQ